MIFLENEILYGRAFDVPDSWTISPSPSARPAFGAKAPTSRIVSFGIGMQYALEAADKLSQDGISAEVIDLRTLRPMDYAHGASKSVKKTNRLRHRRGRLAAGRLRRQLPLGLRGDAAARSTISTRRLMTCTGKDVPMPYAANLERHALITTDEVIAAVKRVTYR